VVDEHGVEAVDVDDALTTDTDVLAPCALGGVLDEVSIRRLRCRIVCGAANNQLATPEDGDRLAEGDIVYVPDYVANAGGVINIAEEVGGYDRDRAWRRVAGIGDTVRQLLADAAAHGITPVEAADRLVQRRLAED
jgi:leucine dehydrogenase